MLRSCRDPPLLIISVIFWVRPGSLLSWCIEERSMDHVQWVIKSHNLNLYYNYITIISNTYITVNYPIFYLCCTKIHVKNKRIVSFHGIRFKIHLTIELHLLAWDRNRVSVRHLVRAFSLETLSILFWDRDSRLSLGIELPAWIVAKNILFSCTERLWSVDDEKFVLPRRCTERR